MILFKLTNIFDSFWSLIHLIFNSFFDGTLFIYLNGILIVLHNPHKNQKLIQQMPKSLFKVGFYLKKNYTLFTNVSFISFLSFILNDKNIKKKKTPFSPYSTSVNQSLYIWFKVFLNLPILTLDSLKNFQKWYTHSPILSKRGCKKQKKI